MKDVRNTPQGLTRGECLGLLSTVKVGRVIFTEQALPAVMPVGFVLDLGDVVMCVPSGSGRLAAATRDTIVAFQADDLDAAGPTGWSVTIVGRARVVQDPGDRAREALRAWTAGSSPEFVRISCQRVSGVRVGPNPPVNGYGTAA
ncbi:pyridoxamine 5'-phosphate oxidase family protein [Actinomadura sp. 3N508]|uniref:pyridoxamine 5'-phosphate oxidase family protein n=1 Tax=Actinomadura sp. 3N508 TaxID=3375153 RepID=UPI0037A63BA5